MTAGVGACGTLWGAGVGVAAGVAVLTVCCGFGAGFVATATFLAGLAGSTAFSGSAAFMSSGAFTGSVVLPSSLASANRDASALVARVTF